jgi:hypothetical protein
MDKNRISSAYITYEQVIDIIDTITDDNFISVTEISKLLSVILNTNKINPKSINKLLLDNNFMIKVDRIIFNESKKKGLKPSKYIPTESSNTYYKKRYYKDISFYIWDFKQIFKIFNIDFKSTLTIDSSIILCKIMGKYSFSRFDIENVFTNLLGLQSILKFNSNKF